MTRHGMLKLSIMISIEMIVVILMFCNMENFVPDIKTITVQAVSEGSSLFGVTF